ncbi:hypothetical protein [Pseudomonas sp. PSB11]|uniref:hypothetical protein n=1 Tax=Pseudomonas sp. PSB11 TaxID=2021969 RepID=UPI001660E0ED|nr:hypothetical protein [Pseudomonas sp. PSB11]
MQRIDDLVAVAEYAADQRHITVALLGARDDLRLTAIGIQDVVAFALYPVHAHRLAVSIRASSPHSVTLMQLRFTSFAVANLRRDFHTQDCAHAGRTK